MMDLYSISQAISVLAIEDGYSLFSPLVIFLSYVNALPKGMPQTPFHTSVSFENLGFLAFHQVFQ